MRYLLDIDMDGNIKRSLYTPDENEVGIELVRHEYEQAQLYAKFDPVTRVFSEPKQQETSQQEASRLDQVEQAIGTLAEQVAKNTLLQGGSL